MPEIGNRLGWLDIADRMAEDLATLEAWVAEVHADGLTNTLLLGMGGSSLGPEVLGLASASSLEHARLDRPGCGAGALDPADLAKTIFVVSSKSGGTIETMSHFKHFYELTGGNGAQFVAVTDPGSPLEALANEKGFRKVWLADPNIGGRYSVLSYFGLVPAALAGVPLDGLLNSASPRRRAAARGENNPGLLLGTKLGELSLAGRDKLTFIVDAPIDSFGLWVEQLIAESTGKHGKGILPVAGEPTSASRGDLRRRPRVRAHRRQRPARTPTTRPPSTRSSRPASRSSDCRRRPRRPRPLDVPVRVRDSSRRSRARNQSL